MNRSAGALCSDLFQNEEIPSNYGYPSGYSLKSIAEQTRILRDLFPGLCFAHEKLAARTLPEGAEGYFAIPRWDKLGSTYSHAVERVLAELSKQRAGKFYDYREGKLCNQYFRQEEAFQKLDGQQKGYDIFVIPAQFGLRYRGCSVRHAREMMNTNEFGLGAFAVGIMLLTHPERLIDLNDLWIDCAGDEYSPSTDGRFGIAPFFSFRGHKLEFAADWFGRARADCGSVSGFLPQ
jgi:hypothetical protein